jgi:hypothetical protein
MKRRRRRRRKKARKTSIYIFSSSDKRRTSSERIAPPLIRHPKYLEKKKTRIFFSFLSLDCHRWLFVIVPNSNDDDDDDNNNKPIVIVFSLLVLRVLFLCLPLNIIRYASTKTSSNCGHSSEYEFR